MRPDVLAHGPIYCHVLPHRNDQFARDRLQRLVAQHFHRAVVRFQRVVEGELLFREAQSLPASVRLAHLARELDELFYHLRRLDGAVLVAPQGTLQHLQERARLNYVLATPGADLAAEQLAQ